MLELYRYQQIRKDLIAQHDVITKRLYQVSFPRQYLLSIDELENIEKITMTDVPDHDHLNRPSMMSATIERIIDILKRLPDSRILAYRNGTDALEIYEVVQNYINNWVEIILEAPEYSHPTIQELYDIEKVALWAFPQYQHQKRMASFRENRDISKPQHHRQSLLRLVGVLKQDDDVESFISYLDNRLPSHLKAYRNEELFNEDFGLNLDSNLFGMKGLL